MDIHSHQVSLRRGVPLDNISSLEFVDRENTAKNGRVMFFGKNWRKPQEIMAFFWCWWIYFKKLVGRGKGGRKVEREEEERKWKKEQEEEKRRRRGSLQFIT